MALLDVIAGQSFPRSAEVACPLCGRSSPPRLIPVRFGMTVSVAECSSCRLAYQTPRPSPQATLAYMNMRWRSRDSYVADTASQRARAWFQLRLVQRIARGGALLDFGAGAGAFVRIALDGGWQACGVERSASAVAAARNRYDVGLLTDLPAGPFDVITLWDVIEHLTEPAALLATLVSRLKPGGWLFIETGNWESRRRLCEGDRWKLFLFDHHFYFSPASLAAVLDQAGLTRFRLLNGQVHLPSVQMGLAWMKAKGRAALFRPKDQPQKRDMTGSPGDQPAEETSGGSSQEGPLAAVVPKENAGCVSLLTSWRLCRQARRLWPEHYAFPILWAAAQKQ